MTESSERVFNNIRSLVQREVNRIISDYLEKKNYNVNEAQQWTNQICNDVRDPLCRFSKPSPMSTPTSNSSPIASSCRRPIAGSTSQGHAIGITKLTERSQ
jgi:hypothetical protein